MRERAEDGSDDKQGEDDDGSQVREDDDWVATTSQRSIRDPDCNERIHCGEGIANGRILILWRKMVSPLLELKLDRCRAYDLSNGIHCWLTLLIMSFEPEDKSRERLTPERLHGWRRHQVRDVTG